MKKLKKKLMALLLTGSFIMTACGCNSNSGGNSEQMTNGGSSGQASSDAAKGRYIETQIDTLEGITHIDEMVKLSDGTLVILDGSNGFVAKSTDNGAGWAKESVVSIQQLLNDPYNELCSLTMNQDGEIYYSYVNWRESEDGENDFSEEYMKIDAQGNETALDMTGVIKSGTMAKAVVAENGKLYTITNGGEVYEVDAENKTGKQLFESEIPNFINIDACGNKLLAVSDTKAYIYDMESGEINSEDDLLNEKVAAELSDLQKTMAFSKGTEEDTIYIADETGVYQHVIDGSVMEQLINGELTTMGNPSKLIADIVQIGEQEFIIAYQDGTLCSYKYDAEAYAVPQEQLNVYSLTDNETVRQAISVMQKNNQDVYVKLEVGMTGEDGVTASDAIKNLNTKMLAGEGPDVIILDGMPVDSYIEKDLLMDMSDLMTDVEAGGNYFNNLLHVYDNNGVYAVPFRCMIPVMSGASSVLSEVTDLTSLTAAANTISDAGTTKTVLGTFTPKQVLKKLYLTSSADWLNEDGAVEEAKVKAYLEAAKQIYEADQKNVSDSDIDSWKERPIYEEDEAEKINEMSSPLLKVGYQVDNYLFRENQILYGNLSSLNDFQMMCALIAQESGLSYDLAVGQTSDVFVPNGVAGIFSGTSKTELAEEFVTTLLSKEVQQTDLSDGFPVNVDAFDAWCVKPENSEYSIGMSDMDGNFVGLDVGWPTEQDFADLKAKINKICKPCLMDTTIQETILDIGVAALTGEKSVEDCVNEIMQKISIYNEE